MAYFNKGLSVVKEVVKVRKTIVIMIALAFILTYTTPLFAIPEPLHKVKAGFVTILTSPLEVTNYATDEMETSSFKPFGLIGGILKGSFYMVKKATTGVVDIVTIPLHLGD